MQSNSFNIVVVDISGITMWSYNGWFIPNKGDIIYRRIEGQPASDKYEVIERIFNTCDPERVALRVLIKQ